MITLATVTCLAIALQDVAGPLHCEGGRKVRLQGIGATEMDDHASRTSRACRATSNHWMLL